MTATASRVERWLLVEHEGAWGPESLPTGRMPASAARALAAAAAGARARLLVVRRHHGALPEEPGRRVFAVESRPGHERILTRRILDDAELETLVPPPDDGLADGWDVHDAPLYLVCTHGRHDRCCAVRGRPVAHALASVFSGQVWECSHVGGDRFAANLVVLPEGYYFGRVEPEQALQLVNDLRDGLLAVEQLRGRSSLPSPVQAAQAFARGKLHSRGAHDLVLQEQELLGRNRWRIRLSGDVEVVVRYDRAGDPGMQLLSCNDNAAKAVPVFRLESLRT